MTYVNFFLAVLFGAWFVIDVANKNWKWHGAPAALTLAIMNMLATALS